MFNLCEFNVSFIPTVIAFSVIIFVIIACTRYRKYLSHNNQHELDYMAQAYSLVDKHSSSELIQSKGITHTIRTTLFHDSQKRLKESALSIDEGCDTNVYFDAEDGVNFHRNGKTVRNKLVNQPQSTTKCHHSVHKLPLSELGIFQQDKCTDRDGLMEVNAQPLHYLEGGTSDMGPNGYTKVKEPLDDTGTCISGVDEKGYIEIKELSFCDCGSDTSDVDEKGYTIMKQLPLDKFGSCISGVDRKGYMKMEELPPIDTGSDNGTVDEEGYTSMKQLYR